MSTEKRRYRLGARADRQRETRQRIVSATVGLHREVGPAQTTIADVARRAGVERLTVYNHFGRIDDLLAACQADFLAASPPPPIAPPDSGGAPLDLLEAILLRLYRWFGANRDMERNVHRDRLVMPELDALLKSSSDPVFDGAAAAWGRRIASRGQARPVRAMVRVAIDFPTWDLLASQGLGNRQIAKLWRAALGAVANHNVLATG